MSDARYALRSLLRSPVLTLVAVLTLAIGSGAATATFAVVKSVLLDPLPYPEADELVAIWHEAPGAGLPSGDPDSDFCGMIIAIAGTATGSSTAPTKCSRPRGASAVRYASQFSGTLTVTRMKSSEPASFFIDASSRELTT